MEEDKTQGKAIGKKGTVLAIIIILIVVAVMALTIRSCTITKKSTGEQSTYTNKLREDKSVDSEKKQVENQENSSKVEKQEQPTEKEIKKSDNNAENKVKSSSNSVNIVGVESEPAMSKVYNTSVVILEKRVYVIDKTSYAHAFIINMLKKDGSDTKITYFCSPEEYGKYLVGDKVGITFKVDSNSTVSVQSIDTVK